MGFFIELQKIAERDIFKDLLFTDFILLKSNSPPNMVFRKMSIFQLFNFVFYLFKIVSHLQFYNWTKGYLIVV